MRFSKSFTVSRRISQSDRSENTEERSQSIEFDIFKLILVIILGIIAWKLASKGVSIPTLVWYLIEVILVIYAALLGWELALVIVVGFDFRSSGD